MVNKKLSQSTPQPAATPARKAPSVGAKRAERPAVKPDAKLVAPPVRPGAETPSRLEGLRRGFRETVTELRKVQWPDRLTTRNLTLVVIGMSTVLALILGGVDAALTWIIEWLVKL